jgi:hypothetical protein
MTVNGKQWKAHRWTWTQAFGPIPDGMLVCHHCDNPAIEMADWIEESINEQA